MKKILLILIVNVMTPLAASQIEPLLPKAEKVEFSKEEASEKIPLSEEAKAKLMGFLLDDSHFEWERVKRCPFIAKYAFYIGDQVVTISPSGNQLQIGEKVFDYQPMSQNFNLYIVELEGQS